MSNFWSKLLADSLESVTVKNTENGPQVLLEPKGTLKELIEVLQKRHELKENNDSHNHKKEK